MVVRANVAFLGDFEFVAQCFDTRFDFAGFRMVLVVFHDEAFRRVGDIGLENAIHTVQRMFDDIRALGGIQTAHEPSLMAIAFRDHVSIGARDRHKLLQCHDIAIVVNAQLRHAIVFTDVHINDARTSFEEAFELLEPSEVICFPLENEVEFELASVAFVLRTKISQSTQFAFFLRTMIVSASTVTVVMVVIVPMIMTTASVIMQMIVSMIMTAASVIMQMIVSVIMTAASVIMRMIVSMIMTAASVIMRMVMSVIMTASSMIMLVFFMFHFRMRMVMPATASTMFMLVLMDFRHHDLLPNFHLHFVSMFMSVIVPAATTMFMRMLFLHLHMLMFVVVTTTIGMYVLNLAHGVPQ
jgi:hypothetical protein